MHVFYTTNLLKISVKNFICKIYTYKIICSFERSLKKYIFIVFLYGHDYIHSFIFDYKYIFNQYPQRNKIRRLFKLR